MGVCEHVTTGTKVLGPVSIVYYEAVQNYCTDPYPGHKDGCPNFDHRKGCPPHAKYFPDVFCPDGCYLAVMDILFCEYLSLFKKQHPTWTDRQLRNPLYWQNYFRTRFKAWAESQVPDGYKCIFVPEAMGVDVDTTCKDAGITLEWPPDTHVYMVAVYAMTWDASVKHDLAELDVIDGQVSQANKNKTLKVIGTEGAAIVDLAVKEFARTELGIQK
jgi:hypothetical protein